MKKRIDLEEVLQDLQNEIRILKRDQKQHDEEIAWLLRQRDVLQTRLFEVREIVELMQTSKEDDTDTLLRMLTRINRRLGRLEKD